jgi:hypothetical protein
LHLRRISDITKPTRSGQRPNPWRGIHAQTAHCRPKCLLRTKSRKLGQKVPLAGVFIAYVAINTIAKILAQKLAEKLANYLEKVTINIYKSTIYKLQ